MVFTVTAILLGSLAALVVSGRYAIRLLTNVTTAFGVSEFTVAFIILAVATSMPELSVAITSSLKGANELVLSTVLGSNIANVTLIIGLTAILSGGIRTTGLNIQRDIGLAIAITLLPLMFLLNGVLSRFEGIILILVFVYYLYSLLRDQATYSKSRAPRHILRGVFSIIGTLIAIALLILAANATVSSATNLAELIGIPAFLIGVFMLSIGTSLPELVTTLSSNWSGKYTMTLGNIIGSNVTNSSLVLGIASIIRPIEFTLDRSIGITMASVAVAILVMGYMAARRDNLSIKDGIFLVFLFFITGVAILLAGT